MVGWSAGLTDRGVFHRFQNAPRPQAEASPIGFRPSRRHDWTHQRGLHRAVHRYG